MPSRDVAISDVLQGNRPHEGGPVPDGRNGSSVVILHTRPIFATPSKPRGNDQ